MFSYVRFDELVKESGKSKAYLARAVGRESRGYFKDCKKTNKNLSDKEVQILSAELGVSVAYLRGETDEKNPPAEEVERQKNIDDIYSIIDDMDPTKLLELSQYALNRAREKMK